MLEGAIIGLLIMILYKLYPVFHYFITENRIIQENIKKCKSGMHGQYCNYGGECYFSDSIVDYSSESCSDIDENIHNHFELYVSSMQFIANEKNLNKVIGIIDGSIGITLSQIDNYIHNTKITYPKETNGTIKKYNLNNEYTYILNYLGEDLFTCFPENSVICLGDTEYKTSLGQINLLRWLIEGNLIDFLLLIENN